MLSLTALVVCVAPLATYALFRFIWSNDVSDGDRLEVIDVLVVAARELAGEEPPPPVLAPWEETLMRYNALGSGSKRPSAGPTQTSATFGSVAPLYFFYPLLHGVSLGDPFPSSGPASHSDPVRGIGRPEDVLVSVQRLREDQEPAWSSAFTSGPGSFLRPGASAPLLAHSLQALAAFLECAKAAASRAALAASLLSLLWGLRAHEDVGVRRAALASAAAVVACAFRTRAMLLAPSVLARSHPGGLDLDNVMKVFRKQPLEGTRAVAGEPAGVLASLVSIGGRIAPPEGLLLQGDEVGEAFLSTSQIRFEQLEESHLAKLVGGNDPNFYDDLCALSAWLHAVADLDPDEEVRKLAGMLTENPILRLLIVGTDETSSSN
jgi:hypothetical protein